LNQALDAGTNPPSVQAILAPVQDWIAGGKLLGAGGGGFVAFVVAPEKRQALREKLKDLIEVDVKVAAPGSRIVVYEPDSEVR
jgi:galactokinase/mevalonate kinase-like predicted kinase